MAIAAFIKQNCEKAIDMQEVLYERLTPSEFQNRLKKSPNSLPAPRNPRMAQLTPTPRKRPSPKPNLLHKTRPTHRRHSPSTPLPRPGWNEGNQRTRILRHGHIRILAERSTTTQRKRLLDTPRPIPNTPRSRAEAN